MRNCSANGSCAGSRTGVSHRPLAQRHSGLGAKIHRHKFVAQKFRERRRGDHGRIVGGKRARRKENGKPLHRRFALKRGPQFLVGGNAAAYEQSLNVILALRRQRLHDQIVDHGALERSHQVEGLAVAEPETIFERRLADARERLSASLYRRFQTLRLYVSQNRRLDSAIGKIEVRPTLFRRGLLMIALPVIALLMIAPAAMLDLRNLYLDRVRIAVRCEPVDDRSSGIAQSQKLRHFIERLSGSVVASVADVPVGPEIFLHLGEIQMRVAAGNNQREHREMKVVISALPLLEQYGMDVSLKMVHGDQRLLPGDSQW